MVEVEVDPQAEPESEELRILLFEAARELLVQRRQTRRDGPCQGGNDGLRQRGICMMVSRRRRRVQPREDPKQAQRSGSGFGLFSIRERLEMLGGRLQVEAAPGRGTCVTVSAPCARRMASRSTYRARRPPEILRTASLQDHHHD